MTDSHQEKADGGRNPDSGTGSGGVDRDWDYVEGVIRDLKIDGYEVSEFKSNTSNARPKKAFLLRVEREVDTETEQ